MNDDDDLHEEFQGQLLRRIQRYRQMRADLRGQLAETQDQLRAVDRRLRSAKELYRSEFGQIPGEQMSLVEDPDRAGRGPLAGLTWGQAMLRVLHEAQEPLHVKQIWDKLALGGFRTGSQDPLRSIVSIALRNPRIIRVAPNTYAVDEGGPEGEHGRQREEGGVPLE